MRHLRVRPKPSALDPRCLRVGRGPSALHPFELEGEEEEEEEEGEEKEEVVEEESGWHRYFTFALGWGPPRWIHSFSTSPSRWAGARRVGSITFLLHLRVGLGPAALVLMPFFRNSRQPGESSPPLGRRGPTNFFNLYSGGSLGRSRDPALMTSIYCCSGCIWHNFVPCQSEHAA